MAENDMRKYYIFAVRAFGDILATILVPALVALLLKYFLNLSQTLFLLLLGLSFILTATVLVRKIKNYGRAFQQLGATEDESRSPRG